MTWASVILCVVMVLCCLALGRTFVAARSRGQQGIPRGSGIAAAAAFTAAAALTGTSTGVGIGIRLGWIAVFLLSLGVGAAIGRRSASAR